MSTGRAGNVIGGGDWSTKRLIPDCIRSIKTNKTIILRNPKNIRLKLATVSADIDIEKLITFRLINLKNGYRKCAYRPY